MNKVYKFKIMFFLMLLIALVTTCISFAKELSSVGEAFNGVPNVTINLSNLDQSGQLIYCGVDLAVFWDPDKDGNFTVVPDDSKVMRYLTRNTNITFDLGPTSTFQKGIAHKLAMRTLYVPAGIKQEPIIIADFSNGKEGWIEIPNSLFIPTYFVNPPDTPYINHTDKWEKNLKIYNSVKASINQTSSIRADSVFWSGEKFMLHVETAEIVSGIAVTILDELSSKNQPYKTMLTNYKINPNVSGGAIYEGELWDDSMFNKWGNYNSKELRFKLEILGADSEVLEEKIIPIVVDNRDLYYRSKRAH